MTARRRTGSRNSAASGRNGSRCALPASDDEIDPLTPRNGQPAEFDALALGAARPRRRSRGAVPARGVSDGGDSTLRSSRASPAIVSHILTDFRSQSECSVRPDRKRADRDDVAIAVALGAIAERLVDRVLFAWPPSTPARAAPRRRRRPRSIRDAASASLRATSSRASAAIDELSAGWKKPVTFMIVGTGTTKTSSSATIMQGTPAIAPQDFEISPRRRLRRLRAPILKKNCPPGPIAIALVFRPGA